MIRSQAFERYHHQLVLKDFGPPAQEKLGQARVLITGAGGLGCVVLQYLAAAGVGTIGIADNDTVELGNLQRQVIYSPGQVGLFKAIQASQWVQQFNPGVFVHTYPIRVTVHNILTILSGYDIVVDASDNSETTLLLNDACVFSDKPLVFAAVSGYEGQLAVCNVLHQGRRTAGYREIFPNLSHDNPAQSCQVAGVMGVVTGIMGMLQCNETIKLITGIGEPLINQLLTYDCRTNQMYRFHVPFTTPAEKSPKSPENLKSMNMETPSPFMSIRELTPDEFTQFLQQEEVTLLDVRENGNEITRVDFPHHHIPFHQLPEKIHDLTGHTIIAFCEHGILSREAARLLQSAFGQTRSIYSLQHGIGYWYHHREREMHEK